MKTKTGILGLLHLLFIAAAIEAAPIGTAFTYQGRLHDDGNPVTGFYDLAFTLYDKCPGGTVVGSPSTVTLNAVPVTNGLFMASLDFGGAAFSGEARWLQIQVKTNLAPNYAILSPCQELKPTAYALHAGTAVSAAMAASLPWSGLTGVAAGPGLTLTGSGFSLDTTFADARYDGRYWKLDGNGGTVAGPNFLGTTDNQPLVLKTGGTEAMRVDATGNVGVGTTAPVDKFHVAGSAIFQGPSPWIDVSHYGAKGDGVTDDTGPLLAALAAVPPSGAIVFVPPGTYLVSSSSGLPIKSGTVLKGAGTATLFKRDSNTNNINSTNNNVIFASFGVTNVTAEDFAIDMNGAAVGATGLVFPVGIGFRALEGGGAGCSGIRIRNLRIYDSVGASYLQNRIGILVQQSDHVWIERNHLSDGMMLKAGGVGDQLIVAENMVEDANDNAITIPSFGPNLRTANYIIRNNVVKAARGDFIYIGDDGRGTSPTPRSGAITYQNILVDGNILLGPVTFGRAMVIVKMATVTERVHIVNNILDNVGDLVPSTQGIEASMQDFDINRPGTDFLIANNSVNGAFANAGIWVRSVRRVRIANNQIVNTNNTARNSEIAIWVGFQETGGPITNGVDTAIVQGNIARGCHNGLVIQNSTKVQAIGNSFTDMGTVGISLDTSFDTNKVSALLMGNVVCNNGGAGIEESGPPNTIDAQYLFNDLRNNAGGAFGMVSAGATRLGNRGAEEYIRRHSSGTSSVDWDAPNVANAASTSTTVSVSGASPGDTVAVGFSKPLPAGALLTGAVTDANTVTVTLANLTGSPMDLNPGTVRADVWKH